MRNNLLIAGAVALSILAAPVFAGERSNKQSFRIVHMSELERNEKTPIRVLSREKVNAAREQASRDSAVLNALRAQGIALKNVIGAKTAFNGVTVYYVK